MKKNTSAILFYISSACFAVAAIFNFWGSKMALGFCDICLAITFCSLGYTNSKTQK